PTWLDDLVQRALAKKPADRIATVRQLVECLRNERSAPPASAPLGSGAAAGPEGPRAKETRALASGVILAPDHRPPLPVAPAATTDSAKGQIAAGEAKVVPSEPAPPFVAAPVAPPSSAASRSSATDFDDENDKRSMGDWFAGGPSEQAVNTSIDDAEY